MLLTEKNESIDFHFQLIESRQFFYFQNCFSL